MQRGTGLDKGMNARGWGLLGAILETSHCIGNYRIYELCYDQFQVCV